jgi:exosortase/archaeosortase family protein
MKEMKKRLKDILLRYLIMIVVAIPELWIFYAIFTPLTVYPTYLFLSLFFDVSISGNIIGITNLAPIEIVDACVAGSAYYLLFILNMATPKISRKNRLKIIGVSFLALLILNLLRLFILSFLHASGSGLFYVTHQIFWYSANLVFVAGIWFFMVRKYKLKEIPFYSDVKYILNLKKKAKKPKHSKKNK